MTTTDTIAGLPIRCPSWCVNEHTQAVDEGCDIEDAAVHRSGDLGVSTDPITTWGGQVVRQGRASFRVQLLADHDPLFWGMPFLEVEAYISDSNTRLAVPLTTGEARVLARQLLHLADRADLDD